MKVLKKHIENRFISKKILDIKMFCGLSVKPCDYFIGIRILGNTGRKYFNVILKERCNYSSREYLTLERCARKGIIDDVMKNGVYRVSIFF